MKKAAVILLLITLVACSSKQDQATTDIKNMEQALKSDASKKEIDPRKGRDLITAYVDYSKAYPSDSFAAECLFRAAELANGMRAPIEALEYYSQVYQKFPASKNAPICLFLQGFVYENNLKNPQKAKAFYEEFLKKYPTHALANDVRFSLQHVGMSDEELIKLFETQNQTQPSVQ